MFKLLLNVITVSSYKLLNTVSYQYPKIIGLCNDIHPNLKDVTKDVANDIIANGYPVIVQDQENTGIICNQPSGHYGYMVPYSNRTDVFINNKLLHLPNTLYNVVLHEMLHAIGLDHSDEPGMMSYAINENWFGYPKEDERKMWLSIDDLQGLYDIKYIQNTYKKLSIE